MQIHVIKGMRRHVAFDDLAFFDKDAAAKKAAAKVDSIVMEANGEIHAYMQTPAGQKHPLEPIEGVDEGNWFEKIQDANRAFLICQLGRPAADAAALVAASHDEVAENTGYNVDIVSIDLEDEDKLPQRDLAAAVDSGLCKLEQLLYIHHNPEDAEEPEYEVETAKKFEDAFADARRLAEQATGKIAYEPATDEGPAGIIVDAISNLSCIDAAESFDKAESGYFTLKDGREFTFSVEERAKAD
ncbi:hypothetical protein [Croceicoccus gelatinilyticus]|uniref:hypothetical protein n=1 Tax=Croceicoccus gelatinilyticus TaxID=2835536 RepID=UPI001BCC4A3F|nr:hypothetical protein [Croceicoccus gelatinilyticus]MBS7671675.1 hypothetical protein [Croceicoccus gelatinilyticus]